MTKKPNSMAVKISLLGGLIAIAVGCQVQPKEHEGQKRVKYFLKDPLSAEFRGEQTFTREKDSLTYCGEVNSKNAYGGFVGFTRYVVIGRAVYIGNDGQFVYREHDRDEQTAFYNMDILSAEMELQLSKVRLENDRLRQQLARESGQSKEEPKPLNRLDYVWDRLCT